jgi:hypothetical protein
MRLGIVHHLGWAVAVTATVAGEVVDRRRLDLIEPGLPVAPFEHEVPDLDDDEAVALVSAVRESAVRSAAAGLDDLAAKAGSMGSIESMSLRYWSPDFPDDLARLRRAPYRASADSVLYRQVLADLAQARGWTVHLYDARVVEGQAARVLGARAQEVLRAARIRLGAPWSKDHRVALAAALLAGDH